MKTTDLIIGETVGSGLGSFKIVETLYLDKPRSDGVVASTEYLKGLCACGELFFVPVSQIIHKLKRGKKNFFCSQSCRNLSLFRASYSRKNMILNQEKMIESRKNKSSSKAPPTPKIETPPPPTPTAPALVVPSYPRSVSTLVLPGGLTIKVTSGDKVGFIDGILCINGIQFK